jgi:futalosine hydrolase
MPNPILILTATGFEQHLLREALQQPAVQTVAHRTWTRGILGNSPVILIETGMGQVNTAQTLAVAFQYIHPELVLQIGIGGAYLPAHLQLGDLVLATVEHYGDLGIITPDGWTSAEAIGIPIVKTNRDYYNSYPLDNTLVNEAESILRKRGEPVIKGPFVTVQQCSGRTDVGNALANRFQAICENMEGAAAAHLCLLYQMPFLELRAISNQVEDRNKNTWNIPLAIERAQVATRFLLESLK